MKVRASLKKRCAKCKMVNRRGHLYIVCSNKPSHKQKQA